MLDRWIRTQRIGLAAYILVADENAEHEVWLNLERELREGEDRYPGFVRGLPPAVVHALLNVPPDVLGGLNPMRAKWEESRDSLVSLSNDANIVPVTAAMFMAYKILYGVGSAGALGRLGKSLIGTRKYEPGVATTASIEASLAILRSPWSRTADRRESIDALGQHFIDAPLWSQIENILYHHVFCWPLLVLKEESSQSPIAAISMPIAVDIDFDRCDGQEVTITPENSRFIDMHPWRESLEKSVQAAKVLWGSKHGGYGEFQKDIYRCGVVFDIGDADVIASVLPGGLTLDDRSMEAYFSQVVLGRFLGRTPSLAHAATGQIGARHTDMRSGFVLADLDVGARVDKRTTEKIGDYDFEWPAFVVPKLRSVFGSAYFETIVLPALDRLDSERCDEIEAFIQANRRDQTCSVKYAGSLAKVADIVQAGGWRQTSYVRCQDVPDAGRPDACLAEELRCNASSVLRLSSRFTAAQVEAVLRNVDRVQRLEIAQFRAGEHPDAQRRRLRPAALSWLFVRTTREEVDARFWYLLWRLIGAPRVDFDKLHHSPTPRIAATHLAAALNCFEPTREEPAHRAPDVLVIVGANRLMETFSSCKNPLFRPLAFGPVAAELEREGVLRPHSSAEMRKLIGSTRIIIVDEEEQPLTMASLLRTAQRLTGEQRTVLANLSIFRFGFTQRMAAVLLKELDITGSAVRDLLKDLATKGCLNEHMGEYYIPRRIGRDLTHGLAATDLAWLHYAAGVAYAPYLSRNAIGALSQDRAFLPENVDEAEYHCRQALEHAKAAGADDGFKGVLRTAIHRLQRFALFQGWHSAVALSKGGSSSSMKDAYELATTLRHEWRDANAPLHTSHLLTIAKIAEERWKELGKGRQLPEEANRLRQEIPSLFREAMDAAGLHESEEDYNLLRATTFFAMFLHRLGTDKTREEAALEEMLTRQARELLDSGTDGSAAAGDWYELQGDRETDDKGAEFWYKRGVEWVPEWHQLWIKLFGSSVSAHGSTARVKTRLAELSKDEERRYDIINYSLGGWKRQRSGPRHIVDRWRGGLRVLEQQFPADRQHIRARYR